MTYQLIFKESFKHRFFLLQHRTSSSFPFSEVSEVIPWVPEIFLVRCKSDVKYFRLPGEKKTLVQRVSSFNSFSAKFYLRPISP